MIFGPQPLDACEGAILAHALTLGDRRLKKGHRLTASDIEAAQEVNISELIVALLEEGDVVEDVAAERIAAAIAADGFTVSPAGTGRVNFHACVNGVVRVDRSLVDRINAVDPGITFSTLAENDPVLDGRMVATVKIIPYAVNSDALKAVTTLMAENPFRVLPYRSLKVGVISTLLPSLKPATIAKTLKVLESRLVPSGATITDTVEVGHESGAVKDALTGLQQSCDLIIVFGASAISDPADVIPSALREAGGQVERVGMPVDPGNLLMLGRLGNVLVIGAPGCARSPARNGFDFVLERLLVGAEVNSNDIAAMGVGGLLMEIGSRPQPREEAGDQPISIAAVILAAGQSRRMGEANKLALPIDGVPMVRHVADAVREQVDTMIAVTGYERSEVEQALEGAGASLVHNEQFAQGLSSSLKTGIEAVPQGCSHAMIVLGDMPAITEDKINLLIDAVREQPSGSIIMSTHAGKRGNPVIWPRAYFQALTQITGDTGARHLLGENSEKIVEVDLGEAASADLDTPEAYAAWIGKSD